MKIYSRFNLLQQDLDAIQSEKGFFSILMRNIRHELKVTLQIEIPSTYFQRVQILCEDIEDLSGIRFQQTDLLRLLYHNFLYFIKRNQDVTMVYRTLFVQPDEPAVLVHHYQDEKDTFEELFPKKVDSSPETDVNHSKRKMLHFPVKRKAALRGEAWLKDLSVFYPDHELTLEKVLEKIYCRFIVKFIRGERQEAIIKILDYLEKETE